LIFRKCQFLAILILSLKNKIISRYIFLKTSQNRYTTILRHIFPFISYFQYLFPSITALSNSEYFHMSLIAEIFWQFHFYINANISRINYCYMIATKYNLVCDIIHIIFNIWDPLKRIFPCPPCDYIHNISINIRLF
jgi:hypothetical protein